MSRCGSLRAVREWSPQQVVAWMRGLDDRLQQYIPSVQQQQLAGEKLLRTSHRDLLCLGLVQAGHQELLLEAVDRLCALNYWVESDKLASLVGKMRAAHHSLSAAVSRRRKSPAHHSSSSHQPPNQLLTAVVELVGAARTLLTWLDRTSGRDSSSSRSRIIQLCLELTSSVQKDWTVYEMEEKVLEVSQALSSTCEKTIQIPSDPSNGELARLEEVHITGVRPGDGLGIYIKSTYDGLHVITGTVENSPADKTQRIHAGDEVVQVNRQTVVGWQLKHLVKKLRAESGGVIMVLKKRPARSVLSAPLKNLRWRPPGIQAFPGLYRTPQPQTSEMSVKASIVDVPPAPSAPCVRLEPSMKVAPGVSMRSRSPNSRLDVEVHRPSDETRTPASPPPEVSQPIPVRLRQRPPARCRPRPMSMPVESFRSGAAASKGLCALRRPLSNEGISAIMEEEPCYPLPYRGHPSVRGVDHIRGSQCFINADLHNSATTLHQEAAAGNTGGPVGKPQASLLGGWFARLRLLSH